MALWALTEHLQALQVAGLAGYCRCGADLQLYSALGGYCLRYVVGNFGNLIGAEFGTNGVGGADVFQGPLSQPDVSIAFALAFMLITMLVVMCGVGGGIERVCSVGMPALFFILIICIIAPAPCRVRRTA